MNQAYSNCRDLNPVIATKSYFTTLMTLAFTNPKHPQATNPQTNKIGNTALIVRIRRAQYRQINDGNSQF